MDGVTLASTLRITSAGGSAGTTTLVLHGELDCASAPHLRKHIGQALTDGTTRLVLDLTGVSFLDAVGLGALIGANRQLRERGGKLELRGTRRPVQRVLEITGLEDLLQPHPHLTPARSCGRVVNAAEHPSDPAPAGATKGRDQ